jgi:hypothetical protein
MENRYIRIGKVIKEVNISLERAIDFFKEKKIYIDETPNAKISEKEFDLLVSQFGNSKREYNLLGFEGEKSQTIKKKKYQNTLSNEIPNYEKYNEENPFEEEIEEILYNKYATGKIIKSIKFNNDILESEFTDFQAFHICKGLKDQRSLYNKYLANKHSEQDIFLAHTLANKLLKEKGRRMIDYILTLPELPFKTDQFKILFSTLDKIRTAGKNDNPIVRLNIDNENGDNEEIEFSFYAVDGTKYINQINVKNKSTRADIFSVTRTGKVLPKENKLSKSNKLNITPVLQFFYTLTTSSDGFNEAVISYGKESGKCSVCGRKLEDEKSILVGIGPVCAGYLK